MKIFLWIRNFDHLQVHTWRAVQKELDEQIAYVLTGPENPGRTQQGWKPVDLSALDVIIMKNNGWWNQSVGILRQYPDAIHVFWGFWSDRRLFPVIIYSANRGIKTVVLNEHYSTSPVGYLVEENLFKARVKVFLRPFLYILAALILKFASNNKKQVCIFPISLQAQEQYLKAGFDKNTLFPFGYFVPKIKVTKNISGKLKHLRLVFVAALLKRKGLDVAINALRILNQYEIKVTLDVYGSGDPQLFIPRDFDAVTYKGIIPTEKAQGIISGYDALLLPSRHDGWGVVVNEAILQSVPAIVSDRVGAKCLLESSGAGLVFENEIAADLAEKIKMLIDEPLLLNKLRANALNVSSEILPEKGARYFLDALSYYFYKTGSRPTAIWCNEPFRK